MLLFYRQMNWHILFPYFKTYVKNWKRCEVKGNEKFLAQLIEQSASQSLHFMENSFNAKCVYTNRTDWINNASKVSFDSVSAKCQNATPHKSQYTSGSMINIYLIYKNDEKNKNEYFRVTLNGNSESIIIIKVNISRCRRPVLLNETNGIYQIVLCSFVHFIHHRLFWLRKYRLLFCFVAIQIVFNFVGFVNLFCEQMHQILRFYY